MTRPELVPRRSLWCNREGHPPVEGDNARYYEKCGKLYVTCAACDRVKNRESRARRRMRHDGDPED